MNKFIKKLGIALSLVGSVVGVFSFTSCGKSDEISIDPKYIVNISKLEYSIKDYETDDVISQKTLVAGKDYYMEVNIDYSAGADTDGSEIINGVFKLYDVSNLEGTIEDANSASSAQKLTFNEDNSEEQCQETTVSFIVPQVANTVKSMKIRVRLTPNFSAKTTGSKATCRASLVVAMDNPSSKFKIGGDHADGETFTVYVQRTTLTAPEITYDADTNDISWVLVENATSYDIYVGNDVLDTITVTNRLPGETYSYHNLYSNMQKAGLATSTYSISVRARGSNNYLPATSNEVRIDYVSFD